MYLEMMEDPHVTNELSKRFSFEKMKITLNPRVEEKEGFYVARSVCVCLWVGVGEVGSAR